MLSTPAAHANTFLGGPWNAATSWSDGVVPDRFTFVQFPATPGGDVQLSGGGEADEIAFDSGASYTFIGQVGAALRARYIHRDGGDATVTISPSLLRGANVDATHGILDINAGGTDYASVVAKLVITSTIVDARDPDFTAGPVATDLYANGTYRGLIQTTGSTTFYGATRLTGLFGASMNSQTVTLSRGQIRLDNSEGTNTNRINDAAVLNFDGADLELVGNGTTDALTEVIGRANVGAGASGIGSDNFDMTASSTSSVGLSRDDDARGTLRLSNLPGGGARLTPQSVLTNQAIVPYVVIDTSDTFRPATYDAGNDGVRGTDDDVGLRAVTTTDFTAAATTGGNALVTTTFAMTGPATIASLTLSGGSFNTQGSSLSVSSGVVAVNGDTTINGNGALTTVIGTEVLLQTHCNNLTVNAPINAGSGGVTFSNYGDFGSGGNFGTRVTLAGNNAWSGQTTMNFGKLILNSAASLPAASRVRLTDAEITFNYNSSTLGNRFIFDGDTIGPDGGRAGFIRDITLKDGQTFTFTGSLEGRGAYFLRGTGVTMLINTPANTPALSTSPGGDLSLWPNAGTTVRVDGQFGDGNQTTGSIIQFGGSTVGRGRITGGFQLSGGTLAPGSSGAAGTAIFRMRSLGYYGGEGHFEINGTTRGTQYDALDVDEFLFMSNEGKLVLENTGFVGQVGQRFDLIKAGSVNYFGKTTLVNPLGVQSGAQWVQIFGDTGYSLVVAGPTGDATIDGRVNFDDLLVLARNYNQGGKTWLTGDFDGDGTVGFADLLALAKRYNTAIPGLTPASMAVDPAGLPSNVAGDWALAQSLVPEPTMLLATLALTSPLLRRRRTA